MTSQFETNLRQKIAALEERQCKLGSELARLEGHLAGLREALESYLSLNDARSDARQLVHSAPIGSRGPDPAKSEWWAYVLRFLETAPPSGFSIDEIGSQLENAGYKIARNTLLASCSKASKEGGSIDRVRVGYYRRRPTGNGVELPHYEHLDVSPLSQDDALATDQDKSLDKN